MRRNTIFLGLYLLAAVIIVMVLVGANTGGATDTDNSYMDDATYVGSASCSGCHSDKHTSWQDTLHPKKIREFSSDIVYGDFTTNPVLTVGENEVTVTLSIEDGKYYVDLDGTGTFKYEITHILGGEGWKQRYVMTRGDSLYILPVQWNIATEEWVGYHATDWYDETTGDAKAIVNSQSWDRRCSGCHATGVSVVYDSTNDEWEASYGELGIGCEGCHGPGSEHNGDASKIWKSDDSAVCGNCHTRGSSVGTLGEKTMGFPMDADGNVIQPGDTIEDFFTVGPNYHTGTEISSSHRQQYVDFISHPHSESLTTITESDHGADYCLECHSTDYRLASDDSKPTVETAKYDIECIACHESHGSSLEHDLRISKEEVCTQCHYSDAEPGESVHHPHAEMVSGTISISGITGTAWMEGEVTCTDCHMPLVAKSAINYDIASHSFFFLSPETSLAEESLGAPNSCTVGCHDGTNGEAMTDQETLDYLEEQKSEIQTKLAAVNTKLTTAVEKLDAASGDTESETDLYNNAVLARDFVESDGTYAHNPTFAMQLLNYAETTADDIIESLGGGGAPGFEFLAVIVALGVAFILLRRRK